MIGHARHRYSGANSAQTTKSDQPKVEGRENGAILQLTPLQTSSYILSMTTELRVLAKSSGFEFLTYLLEMVFQEAFRLTSNLEQAETKGQAEPRS